MKLNVKKSMICTVTLNPAYDKTVVVRGLIPHQLNHIIEERFDPGGKGINVSRAIHEMGHPTRTLGIIGGDTGLFIREYLRKRNMETDFVEIDQPTRMNLTIIDLDNPPDTKLNEPGPEIDERTLLKLEKTILSALSVARLFVLAGSLPRACPADTYRRLINLIRDRGGDAILDTRDEALEEGLKALPLMIKPNADEAENLLKTPVQTPEQAGSACRKFHEMGIRIPIISLGRDGAVMACKDGIFRAVPPPIKVDSTVGAGDSLVAGMAIGLFAGMPLNQALRLGVSAGTATATTPGTSLCRKDAVEAIFNDVTVERMD